VNPDEYQAAYAIFFWASKVLETSYGLEPLIDGDGDARLTLQDAWNVNGRFWIVSPGPKDAGQVFFRGIYQEGKVFLWFGLVGVQPTEGGTHIEIPDTSEESLAKIHAFVSQIRILLQS